MALDITWRSRSNTAERGFELPDSYLFLRPALANKHRVVTRRHSRQIKIGIGLAFKELAG